MKSVMLIAMMATYLLTSFLVVLCFFQLLVAVWIPFESQQAEIDVIRLLVVTYISSVSARRWLDDNVSEEQSAAREGKNTTPLT